MRTAADQVAADRTAAADILTSLGSPQRTSAAICDSIDTQSTTRKRMFGDQSPSKDSDVVVVHGIDKRARQNLVFKVNE